jgi:hypothetical protein
VRLDAGEIAGQLVGKCRKETTSCAPIRVLAGEEECSCKPLLNIRLLCHFQTSHPFGYSKRNSRLSDACRAMKPNELILRFVV